jgi:hypothetical protein
MQVRKSLRLKALARLEAHVDSPSATGEEYFELVFAQVSVGVSWAGGGRCREEGIVRRRRARCLPAGTPSEKRKEATGALEALYDSNERSEAQVLLIAAPSVRAACNRDSSSAGRVIANMWLTYIPDLGPINLADVESQLAAGHCWALE